jgi:hypothetical protein
MPHCAFLSMDTLEDFVSDDDLTYAPLDRLGWKVTPVSWHRPDADWNAFAAVVIRTPWDYQNDPEAFLAVLETIERSSAALLNPLSLVKWNLRKTYLRELERAGVEIIPTIWSEDAAEISCLSAWFDRFDVDELVVKPVVSANADHTYRVPYAARAEMAPALMQTFAKRPYMAQPFIRAVVEEGEFSTFFFNGEYSHAILKTPKPNDFRVQEEHGGIIQSVTPSAALLAASERVLRAVTPLPLYARADFVRLHGERFALVELELIEPGLYFRMDADAPERFAQALDAHLRAVGRS